MDLSSGVHLPIDQSGHSNKTARAAHPLTGLARVLQILSA